MSSPKAQSTPHSVGVYLAFVQFFFTITWTVYVIFLPKLAAQAGIPKTAIPYILLLDQIIFVFMDFAMGSHPIACRACSAASATPFSA